jgi:hypothetical protein
VVALLAGEGIEDWAVPEVGRDHDKAGDFRFILY